MEIRKRASRRRPTELNIVAPERPLQVEPNEGGDGLLLYFEDNESIYNQGAHFDYFVSLTRADLDKIRDFLTRRTS
jgi:hypothetical protein